MTSKRFVAETFVVIMLLFMVMSVSVNRFNDYGLFEDVTGKSFEVMGNERTDKLLFSFNYIPNNFEGILIGPSLSDNLNTKDIKDYKIYNASINGGNVTELRKIVDTIAMFNNNIRFIIICLDPYITKDSGMKTTAMGLKELVRTVIPLNAFVKNAYSRTKALVFPTSLPENTDQVDNQPDYYNDYGYYNFNIDKVEIEKNQETEYKKMMDDFNPALLQTQKIDIDMRAYEDLKHIIDTAHKENWMVFAYYYPRLRPFYRSDYKDRTINLFSPGDCVWDFNDDEYIELTADYRSYCDLSHLSYDGAEYVLNVISIKLHEHLEPRK